MGRLNRKRLAVDIPVDLHKALDKLAKIRNCTMTKLVIRSLIDMVHQHEKYHQT